MLHLLALFAYAVGHAFAQYPNQGGPGTDQPSERVECYQQAKTRTTLTDQESLELCRGATSLAPVQCYQDGNLSTLLSTRELLTLCKCAPDADPVACYSQADTTTTMGRNQAISLCADRSDLGCLYASGTAVAVIPGPNLGNVPGQPQRGR